MPGESTIGERLRRIRRERGMTQEQLAGKSAVSRDLISMLERGTRSSARLGTITALAVALDSELSELLDKRDRMGSDRDGGSILAIRDVLLSPALLPGIDPTHDGGEPTPLDRLEASVRRGWRRYWEGSFGELAAMLPALIGEARITRRSEDARAAILLAQAYQLSGCFMVHMGRDDLAAIGAERAITAATQGSDELLWATLHGTYSWVLLHQARLRESEELALRVADRVEPKLSHPHPAKLTVWGGLMLTAMAAAAAASRTREAAEYIAMAQAAAARLDAERHDYWVPFGPTQVQMQATHAYAVLREPGDAIEHARRVQPKPESTA